MDLPSHLEPGRPIYAIGDTHGQFDKLHSLWSKLTKQPDFQDSIVVFLGDYVDRGPNVRESIDFLISQFKARAPGRTAFISGNHDFSFSAFLGLLPAPDGFSFSETWKHYSPQDHLWNGQPFGSEDVSINEAVVNSTHLQGRRYLINYASGHWHFDCSQTFASYGCTIGDREAMLRTMPSEHLAFFSSLPWIVEHPEYVFVHSGLSSDPVVLQEELRILRERDVSQKFIEPFSSRGYREPPPAELLPQTVVSGHVRVEEPFIVERRILCDTTGGWKGGLTAVRLPSASQPEAEIFQS